jgi:hypothetical protein
MVGHGVEGYFRHQSGPGTCFGGDRLAMRFAEHLDVAQRVGKARGAEIEVIQGQRLLKFRGSFGQPKLRMSGDWLTAALL